MEMIFLNRQQNRIFSLGVIDHDTYLIRLD